MNSSLHALLLAVPLLLQLTGCAAGGQKTYYPDGTLKSVRTPNFIETYHENGKVKERMAVNSAGQRYGDTVEYLSDGRAWSSRPYRNGEANGTEYRLYPKRTPICSWRDGIVRSVYQDGGWVTRELTPAEQASIERREEAERLRVEMAMRKAERDEESRQNTLAALQGLSAGLQSLNRSTASYSSSYSSSYPNSSRASGSRIGELGSRTSSSANNEASYYRDRKTPPITLTRSKEATSGMVYDGKLTDSRGFSHYVANGWGEGNGYKTPQEAKAAALRDAQERVNAANARYAEEDREKAERLRRYNEQQEKMKAARNAKPQPGSQSTSREVRAIAR